MTENVNKQSLGQVIRKRRTERNMTLRDVATAARMTDSSVLRIERGEFAQPKPETLKAIADVLDLDLSDLFSLSGYVQPTTLPTFAPYLRSKYADLPESAAREIEESFAAIAAKHGYDPRGPKFGEDETN